MEQSLYLAPFEHESDLAEELAFRQLKVVEQRGRLFLVEGASHQLVWAQVSWPRIVRLPITSIGDGAKKLKALGRNWALYSAGQHRRAELIQEQLPHYPTRPIAFLQQRPQAPMGGWTLWENDLILASPSSSSPYPLAEMSFQEDQVNPPSRAYLKLWEFFTCYSPRLPTPSEHLLDMGACPGGWTWVLQSFGGSVTAVDKAPLEPRIAALPGVSVRSESAFGINPADLPAVDWFFSDIICYPERLLELVKRWERHGVKNFVCTIKFQGPTDHATTERFVQELGGRVIHQHHNKHEVTWYRVEA